VVFGEEFVKFHRPALQSEYVDLFFTPGFAAAQQDFHRLLRGKAYESAMPETQKPLINYGEND
jgi:hypothetical protein